MKITDFDFLNQLQTGDPLIILKNTSYQQVIYDAKIPYRPGVYLVFSLNNDGSDKELLYYGKAGVTNYPNNPELNFHQLPLRLLAATKAPDDFDSNKKDVTRAKLWPWYVKTKFTEGIKIYWFITQWPEQNPVQYEKRIKARIGDIMPEWRKSI